MSKLTRKYSNKLTKINKNLTKNNKKSLNDIISNKNLLVNSNSFKTYEIPQLEKWKNLLNKEEPKHIEENKLTNIKYNKTRKSSKKNKSKNKKSQKRKYKNSFFNLF